MIKIFFMDCDGTLTDGVKSSSTINFNAKDGMGLRLLKAAGIINVIMSASNDKRIKERAAELEIDICLLNICDKLKELKRITKELNIKQNEIAYIGDDVQDKECIKYSYLTFAPCDAEEEIKNVAEIITERAGGKGAVRDACNMILVYNERL